MKSLCLDLTPFPERINGVFSLYRRGDRLAFFDNVGRQYLCLSATDVPAVVYDSGRDKEVVARAKGHRRLALNLKHERAVQDIPEFLAGMGVLTGCRARIEFGPDLDSLSSGYGKVSLLQHRAGKPRLLRHQRLDTKRTDQRYD